MLAKDRVVVSKLWIAGYWWRIVEDQLLDPFGLRVLEAGLPAFQLPMYSMCDALPKKRFVGHVCLRNPCLLWNLSLHSLPEAWGPWEPQYTPPVLHYACIMPIPSLQLQKKTCLMQRSTAFGHAVVVSKICCNTVIVLSVVVWDCCKPTNNCRDWAFSNSGLEVGLPAFQLPMFAKCDALPKGDLLDMFVYGIHAFCEI